MLKKTLTGTGAPRTLIPALILALMSYPLAAVEVVTVDGTRQAAQVRAQQTRFESQMDAYVKGVGIEFRAALEMDLRQSVKAPMRLARGHNHRLRNDTHRRG